MGLSEVYGHALACGGQWPTLGIFLNPSLPYCLRQSLSLNLALAIIPGCLGSQAPRITVRHPHTQLFMSPGDHTQDHLPGLRHLLTRPFSNPLLRFLSYISRFFNFPWWNEWDWKRVQPQQRGHPLSIPILLQVSIHGSMIFISTRILSFSAVTSWSEGKIVLWLKVLRL